MLSCRTELMAVLWPQRHDQSTRISRSFLPPAIRGRTVPTLHPTIFRSWQSPTVATNSPACYALRSLHQGVPIPDSRHLRGYPACRKSARPVQGCDHSSRRRIELNGVLLEVHDVRRVVCGEKGSMLTKLAKARKGARTELMLPSDKRLVPNLPAAHVRALVLD